MQDIGRKLEHPLEASESVAELGDRYVALKEALDEKWMEWEVIFSD